MSRGQVPATIGCVGCGREYRSSLTVFAQCDGCGKTVGMCLPCTRTVVHARQLLDESMEWHEQHACRGPLRAEVDRIMAGMRGQDQGQLPERRGPRRLPVARILVAGRYHLTPAGQEEKARRAAELAKAHNGELAQRRGGR